MHPVLIIIIKIRCRYPFGTTFSQITNTITVSVGAIIINIASGRIVASHTAIVTIVIVEIATRIRILWVTVVNIVNTIVIVIHIHMIGRTVIIGIHAHTITVGSAIRIPTHGIVLDGHIASSQR